MRSDAIDPLVRGVFIREGQVLLLKRPKNKGGGYNLVGGHVERGESPLQALRREIQEEIGVGIDTEHLELMRLVYREKKEASPKLHLVYWVHEWEGEPVNREPSKCLDIAWFPLDQLPHDLATVAGLVLRLEDQTPFYVELKT
jgi:ADP-ribose pyrophosphatase YjhB (NUDIX family)